MAGCIIARAGSRNDLNRKIEVVVETGGRHEGEVVCPGRLDPNGFVVRASCEAPEVPAKASQQVALPRKPEAKIRENSRRRLLQEWLI